MVALLEACVVLTTAAWMACYYVLIVLFGSFPKSMMDFGSGLNVQLFDFDGLTADGPGTW